MREKIRDKRLAPENKIYLRTRIQLKNHNIMKSTKYIISILFVMLLLVSCGKIRNRTKQTINKGGETVGKAATEFFEGVHEGIDKTLQCEVLLSKHLTENGLRTGKFAIENADEGINNRLVIYLIFDKDFESPITAKTFDKNGLEIGRSKIDVEGKADDAGYFDFIFDKRSYIEVKSKIVLE